MANSRRTSVHQGARVGDGSRATDHGRHHRLRRDQLGDVVFVELPDGGRPRSRRAESFGVVESAKAVSRSVRAGRGQGGRGQRGAADAPELVNEDRTTRAG